MNGRAVFIVSFRYLGVFSSMFRDFAVHPYDFSGSACLTLSICILFLFSQTHLRLLPSLRFYAALPRGRVKCCTPSACPYVHRFTSDFLETGKP